MPAAPAALATSAEVMTALNSVLDVLADERPTPSVLEEIIEHARGLSGAAYVALWTRTSSDRPGHFLCSGTEATTVEQIARLAESDGLRHLDLPIQLQATQVGNLHLAGTEGDFDEVPEGVLQVLARAAGVAVMRERLQLQTLKQQRWSRATAETVSHLMSLHGEDPLSVIASDVLDLAAADFATIALLDTDRDEVVVEVAAGGSGNDLVGMRVPTEETVVGQVLATGRPLLLEDAAEEAKDALHAGPLRIGPLMALPIRSSDGALGTLSLGRLLGGAPFTDADLTLAMTFADQASIALQLAQARTSEQRVVLLEDRDRIARDLHDHVIQELFSIGLTLGSIASRPGLEPAVHDRLLQRVEDLDRTVRRIRTTIFDLRGPLVEGTDVLRRSVLEVAGELTVPLGFAPRVTFGGVLTGLPADLTDDVVAVVREGLSNVARHAHASVASVEVVAESRELRVVIFDDGVGPGTDTAVGPGGGEDSGHGVSNLASRAAGRSGRFHISPGVTHGTVMTWAVPLP